MSKSNFNVSANAGMTRRDLGHEVAKIKNKFNKEGTDRLQVMRPDCFVEFILRSSQFVVSALVE